MTLFEDIDAHHQQDVRTLIAWCNINTGSYHLAGLERMLAELQTAFVTLGGEESIVDLPDAEAVDASGTIVHTRLGRGLRIIKRPAAPRRVLLNIHYDTVFGVDSAFRSVKQTDADTLNGPGVCDAKGGIITMLAALRAFEQAAPSDVREALGWEVYLNPDEEIGSPGSIQFFREAAARNHFGLLFESALPDGSLLGERKGSGTFSIVVRGRAAHAGRDFHAGRSATVALADLILRLGEIGRKLGGDVTINCGRIEGGGAVNVVPDLAIGRFNVRVGAMSEMTQAVDAIQSAANEVAKRDGITLSIHGGFASPPKLLDARSQALIDAVRQCAKEVGLGDLAVKPSGGASDGNKLSAVGLPLIDTLGPVGGEIHSDREFVKTSTIASRAKMTALLLTRIAQDAIG